MTAAASLARFRFLKKPEAVQDFLNTLPFRSPESEPIVRSPEKVLETRTASCMEGALLAAAALMAQGGRPLLLDLKVAGRSGDVDHVVALFRRDGRWGAISKTSHAVLRYREAVYKSVRELAMSYFHEYFTDEGKKTLRSFSRPFDVSRHFGSGWLSGDADLWEIAAALDDSPHEDILTKQMERALRRADGIEIAAGKLVDLP